MDQVMKFMSTLLLIISLVLLMMNQMFMMSVKKMREKSSTFECGFDPNSFSRLPFSMHFFLIALIFLIFDVEISLLVPMSYSWSKMTPHYLYWLMILVVMILLTGTVVEWVENSLEWHL